MTDNRINFNHAVVGDIGPTPNVVRIEIRDSSPDPELGTEVTRELAHYIEDRYVQHLPLEVRSQVTTEHERASDTLYRVTVDIVCSCQKRVGLTNVFRGGQFRIDMGRHGGKATAVTYMVDKAITNHIKAENQ